MRVEAARELVAADVRSRLYEVVAPFVSAVIGRLDPPAQALALGQAEAEVSGRRVRCSTRALLQHRPPMLRVVLIGMKRAVELERFSDDEVPGLRAALDDVLGGVLSNLSHDHATEALLAAASQRPGGLVAWFDLATGDIRVLVAKAGEDLSRAVEVGAIVSCLETTTH